MGLISRRPLIKGLCLPGRAFVSNASTAARLPLRTLSLRNTWNEGFMRDFLLCIKSRLSHSIDDDKGYGSIWEFYLSNICNPRIKLYRLQIQAEMCRRFRRKAVATTVAVRAAFIRVWINRKWRCNLDRKCVICTRGSSIAFSKISLGDSLACDRARIILINYPRENFDSIKLRKRNGESYCMDEWYNAAFLHKTK